MQHTLSVIIIAILSFSLLGTLVLLFWQWRQKQHQHKHLEQLVDEISEQKSNRHKKIYGRLTNKYQLDKTSADDLANLLYDAEKQFLQKFIEQQMQNSVEGFYEELCILLDNFLNALPAESVKVGINNKIDQATNKLNTEPVPDWGDVFD